MRIVFDHKAFDHTAFDYAAPKPLRRSLGGVIPAAAALREVD